MRGWHLSCPNSGLQEQHLSHFCGKDMLPYFSQAVKRRGALLAFSCQSIKISAVGECVLAEAHYFNTPHMRDSPQSRVLRSRSCFVPGVSLFGCDAAAPCLFLTPPFGDAGLAGGAAEPDYICARNSTLFTLTIGISCRKGQAVKSNLAFYYWKGEPQMNRKNIDTCILNCIDALVKAEGKHAGLFRDSYSALYVKTKCDWVVSPERSPRGFYTAWYVKRNGNRCTASSVEKQKHHIINVMLVCGNYAVGANHIQVTNFILFLYSLYIKINIFSIL